MNNKEFVWNDTLVSEFCNEFNNAMFSETIKKDDLDKFKKSKQVENTLESFLDKQAYVAKIHDLQYHFNYNGVWCTGIVTKFWNKISLRIMPDNNTEDIGAGAGCSISFDFDNEKQVESNKDWEIVSFKGSSGKIYNANEELLTRHHTIHSVKRLSTSEVLSINDETKFGKITKFEIQQGLLYVWTKNDNTWHSFEYIEKPKQPLFTTEQREEINYMIYEFMKDKLK